jgi:hypothetical protein
MNQLVNIAVVENGPFLGGAPLFINDDNKYQFADALYCLHEYLYSRIENVPAIVNKVESLITKAINHGILKGSVNIPSNLGGGAYYFEVIGE